MILGSGGHYDKEKNYDDSDNTGKLNSSVFYFVFNPN